MYYLDVLRHRTLEQISGLWNNTTRQSLDTGDAILSVDASSCFRWKPDAMHHSVDQSHKTCQEISSLLQPKSTEAKQEIILPLLYITRLKIKTLHIVTFDN